MQEELVVARALQSSMPEPDGSRKLVYKVSVTRLGHSLTQLIRFGGLLDIRNNSLQSLSMLTITRFLAQPLSSRTRTSTLANSPEWMT